MTTHSCPFPDGFIWGVATAAPQIEGAAFADGKGESIWDRFCRIPGKVRNGDTLDVACDHYHRYPEDIALLVRLGIKHYRMSIAWPRIYPAGDGAINPKGLEFYRKLFVALQENGITPWVTLFHWDLPQALEDRGGWRARVTVDAYGRYAETVVKEFSPFVKHWITLNEIRCFTVLGYSGPGRKAPGADEPPAVINQTYHHALVCHGLAVKAVRSFGGPGAVVGLTDNADLCVPLTETYPDVNAARAYFTERNLFILDPIYHGKYSDAYLAKCGADAPRVSPGDFDLIGLPTDFLGMNIYTARIVRAGKDGKYEVMPLPEHYPRADSVWLNIVPQAIYWGPRLAAETYGIKSIYITENGCGYDIEPVEHGEVMDLHRREYLRSYLREMQGAISDGVPIHGYFLWSLMDNYEWEDGYTRRFGVVHCDFQTQVRTPKVSALWYAQVVGANRIL
jgi:beta-glucosidase